jgi:uncharacterized phage protein gp47/JayE
MAKKSFTEIVSDMQSYIQSVDSTKDTSVGSVLRDVVIEPPANEIENIYSDNEHIEFLHSLFHYAQMSEDELDRWAYNFGKTRKPAVKSTGTCQFRRNTAPTEDVVIPSGSKVSTKRDADEDSVDFLTTESQTMAVANAASYYNSVTGFYEISVAVEAVDAGTVGNVAGNQITVLTDTITGIDSVNNNAATSGGEEQESNQELSTRVLIALTGNNVGTESGYISTLLEDESVNDAELVGPGDDLMTRDLGLGGKVDIYVNADIDASTSSSAATPQSYVYQDLSGGNGATDSLNDVILASQPVNQITSVVGSVSGTFTQDVDYELQVDSTSAFAGSTRALDKLHWLKNVPVLGEQITINYTYYSLLAELDALIDANRNVTADVLVKLAVEQIINVTLTVYADSTITDQSQFEADIRSAINSYLNSDSLANQIDQSDIVTAITSAVSGVDRVALPFTALNAPNKTGYQTGVNDTIPLTANEYSSAGTITVTGVLAS